MLNMHPSRQHFFQQQFQTSSFQGMLNFLEAETSRGARIYPEKNDIYKAFELCGLDDIKVVIIGQDPYHSEGQAMGLAFSVPDGVKKPPSLVNIYKELALEYPGYICDQSGNLTKRAEQGVLLLNTSLTVQAGKPWSHAHIWRQDVCHDVISYISEQKSNVVFLLWWSHAISKKPLIDERKHLALTAPHPSPLSAYRGWFGCGHFRQANEWLSERGEWGIEW
jgi:uracil-DNA glycosylase